MNVIAKRLRKKIGFLTDWNTDDMYDDFVCLNEDGEKIDMDLLSDEDFENEEYEEQEMTYVPHEDFQNCVCWLHPEDAKILKEINDNEEKIIKDCKKLVDENPKGDYEEIIEQYLKDNYGEFTDFYYEEIIDNISDKI